MVVDGIEVAPQPVAAEVHVPPAHVWLDAMRDVLTEATNVRMQSPWAETAPAPSVVRPGGKFRSSFHRMIAVRPAQLEALPRWWAVRACEGRVTIGRRLALEEPRPSPAPVWCIPARLRSPFRLRSIPVEFWLWPHLDAWSKLAVEPQRGVRGGRRYFASGHRVLDQLTDTLIIEL